MRILKDLLDVVVDAFACEFEQALLHGPQPYEHDLWPLGLLYFEHLRVAHGIAGDPLIVTPHTLYVYAYRLAAEYAGGGLLAVAQAEVQLRMADYRGLAMLAILKQGILVNAFLFVQGLLQQQIGRHTLPLTLFVFVAQGLFAALRADGLQGCG